MKFTTIHGIGAHTARKLYDIGLRSFEDLERYGNVNSDNLEEANGLAPNMPAHETYGAKRLIWTEGLLIREDLEKKYVMLYPLFAPLPM
jgi:hypothetical protein